MKRMIDTSVEERLTCWIQDDHYLLISDSRIIVQEQKDDGHAVVECTLPAGQTYELTLEGKEIRHLKSKKCNDGILLIHTLEGQWELHIIECKRTVNRSKWGKTKLQFEATIQRALALLSSIGVFPDQIKLYTAVRKQEILDEKNADPVLSKMTLRQWQQLTDEEKEKLHYMDWFDTSIDIWVRRGIPHEIIHLDDDGQGRVIIHPISY